VKNKVSDILAILLFCGFLGLMAVLYLTVPKEAFSETEKRYLAEFPDVRWDTVSSGEWGADVETYMADHIPGRDFFVGLNAYFDLYTGRQAGKDVLLTGGRLVEAPVSWDQAAVDRNLTAIRNLAEATGQQLDLMIVPSAGWAGDPGGYPDEALIADIYAAAGSGLRTVTMTDTFRDQPGLYFRTDHHWNSAGAYAACAGYAALCGKDFPSADFFTRERIEGFSGSTYSRSALWLTPAEELEIWHGSQNLTVTNGEAEDPHDGVIYRERLEEADKYTVFLDGNHSIVRIHNPNAVGKLLVIRDSYSNLLGCFLAEAYEEVVLVDLRYYKQPVSQLMAEEGFDNILVCYSLGNFMTDANFIWLK